MDFVIFSVNESGLMGWLSWPMTHVCSDGGFFKFFKLQKKEKKREEGED